MKRKRHRSRHPVQHHRDRPPWWYFKNDARFSVWHQETHQEMQRNTHHVVRMRHRTCMFWLVLGLVALAAGLATIPVFAEGGLSAVNNEWHVEYQSSDGMVVIGAIAQSADGRKVYCVQTGAAVTYDIEDTQPIADSTRSRSLAWLMKQYQQESNPLIHAGIGVIAHDEYDVEPEKWESRKQALQQSQASTLVEAERLRQLARNHTPTQATLDMQYETGKRRGFIEVAVRGTDEVMVSAVPFTVKLEGPAIFDDAGTTTMSGISTSSVTRIAWSATGTGQVSASVSYEYGSIEQVVSNQDYVRVAGMKYATGKGVNFSARKEFAPLIKTSVANKVINEGEPVVDVVTCDVAQGDVWESGVTLKALGYYFDTLRHEDLGKVIHPNDDESADSYLARLGREGYQPSGYANVLCDAPQRSLRVQAHTEIDGKEDYLASADAGFGTWVWVIDHDEQNELAQQYVVKDALTDFLEVSETLSIRRKVSVDSSVTEHSATLGAELSDVITVSGFSADSGSFTGNQEYGFRADTPSVEVSVMWSGSGNGANDEPYKPQSTDIPHEDSHHQLIGSWQYQASNGIIKVGAGARDKNGEAVNIVADKPGYYVFLYTFAGDDRFETVSSAYDDAWERVTVQSFAPLLNATLSTKAHPASIHVGESSYDAAYISAKVPEGSYVTFSAYAADEETAAIDLAQPIVDEERVDLRADCSEQTVHSSRIVANTAGTIQWKATLWSPANTIIDSHELGMSDEITTVTESERAQPSPSPEAIEPAVQEGHATPLHQQLAQTGVSDLTIVAATSMVMLTMGIVLQLIPRIQMRRRKEKEFNPKNVSVLAYP